MATSRHPHAGVVNHRKDGYIKICDRYAYLEKDVINKGTYGIVYKGQDVIKNCAVAIKKVKVIDSNQVNLDAEVFRECIFMKHLHHANIVKLIEYVLPEVNKNNEKGKKQRSAVFGYLMMPLYKTTLEKKLKKYRSQGLGRDRIEQYTRELLSAISYLHLNNIMHRDMKPSNIMIKYFADKTTSLRVGDFGLAKQFCEDMMFSFEEPEDIARTPEVVTLYYRSPEIVMFNYYNERVDVWSIGCIIVEMCLGDSLFHGKDGSQLILSIFKVLGTPSIHEWPEIYRCKPLYKLPPASRTGTRASQLSNYINPARHGEKMVNLITESLTLNPRVRPPAGQLLAKYFP